MANKFSISNLQELQKSIDIIKKDKIDEMAANGHVLTTIANDGNPQKKTGRSVLMELQQSLATGKPTSSVSLMNDITSINEGIIADEHKQIKRVPNPKVSSKANNRDDNDDFYDEQVRLRMLKAANKIQETAIHSTEFLEEEFLSSPQRKPNGNMMINESQLLELADKALKSAMANLYSKEKIKEVLMEEKNEIKKIVYETLKELREINEKKKNGK